MHHLAKLKDGQPVEVTVDEILKVFDQLVDCGNECGNIHTYFSGCCISGAMLRNLKSNLINLSHSFFASSASEKTQLIIHLAEPENGHSRITHISKDGKWYVFKDGYEDIHLSLISEN